MESWISLPWAPPRELARAVAGVRNRVFSIEHKAWQGRLRLAIKTSIQVDNSQLRPSEPQEFPFVQNFHAYELSRMEGETESTASSLQPPLPRGRGYSSMPEMRFPKPVGVRIGANDRGILANDEHRPSRSTSAKTSPVKVQKPVKIKRRSSKTTSDVWSTLLPDHETVSISAAAWVPLHPSKDAAPLPGCRRRRRVAWPGTRRGSPTHDLIIKHNLLGG